LASAASREFSGLLLGFGELDASAIALGDFVGDALADDVGDTIAETLLPLLQPVTKTLTAKKQLRIQRNIFKTLDNLLVLNLVLYQN
jgi:hypothetical protein